MNTSPLPAFAHTVPLAESSSPSLYIVQISALCLPSMVALTHPTLTRCVLFLEKLGHMTVLG